MHSQRTTQDDVRRLLADVLDGERQHYAPSGRSQAVEVKQILQFDRAPTWVPALVATLAAIVSVVSAVVSVIAMFAGEP